MRKTVLITSSVWLVVIAAALAVSPVRAQQLDDETQFELKVRPILSGTCFKCHGGQKTSGGLRVDSRAALIAGGETGPAIVPGDPDKSLLISAVRYHDEQLKMPPDRPLPAEAVNELVSWVKRGAPWPAAVSRDAAAAFRSRQHWAFAPVAHVAPPADSTGWAEQPIDRFIMADLRQRHLRPLQPADKRTLVRRIYFDLIGLPPKPEEASEFVANDSPHAVADLVERLLALPRYGERWGRFWMDVVRYADTAGDNADYPIPEARRYRDYIIDAFNADKPYDQFVREQIAGDLLAKESPPEKYAELITATGFLALSRRYFTGPYEHWNLTLEDSIDTTGRALLGMTLRCARCHDHKFDPVTQEDYYGLYGILASTQYPYAGSEELVSKVAPRMHFVPTVRPEQAAPKIEAYQERVRQLKEEISKVEKDNPVYVSVQKLKAQISELVARRAAAGPKSPDWPKLAGTIQQLKADLGRDERQMFNRKTPLWRELKSLYLLGLPADLPMAYAVVEGAPVDEPIQKAGDSNNPGAVVPRHVPRFLGSETPRISKQNSGRLELANWITRPENPLFARVMVNRIWQHHFGKGLVTTASNFGLRGAPASHPQLLDWLAGQFISSGWSVKAMHRLMIHSKTYQLASGSDEANERLDSDNRWYWRFDRQRLDAEALRDALLDVAGQLDLNRPGDHPFPEITKWIWTQHDPFRPVYASNHRSVYLMTQRIQRHPYLALFDGPDTNASTDVRTSSTVPLQALFLMNSPFVLEQSQAFARRVIDVSLDVNERVARAYQWVYSRSPQPVEYEKSRGYLLRYGQELERLGVAARDRDLQSWTSYARVLLTSNEMLYVD